MNTDTGGTSATTTGDPASSGTTPGSTAGQTTEQQTAAAAAAAAAQSGSATGTEGQQGAGAATGDSKPWQDSLAGDLATNPLFRTYKTVDDLAKAHDHLTKLKGATAAELLKIPSKPQDQAPEDWAPIHKALGVPEDPKDYKIELAAEAAADTPELANILRELGGKAKLQPGQMNAVIETLNDLGKKAAEAEAAQATAAAAETDAALKKEWGAAYEANKRGIGKLILDAAGGQLDEAAQADLAASIGSNLTLARVLAHAIGKMAEPETPGENRPEPKALTPAAATAALNAFYADPAKTAALNNRNDPQHKAVLAERAALLAQQNGERRPDQPG